MADDVTVTAQATYTVSADQVSGGSAVVQRVKLAYSADGSETPITADSGGLLVNLGTNNDITLTSGTLTAIAGTVTTAFAGTPVVSLGGGSATAYLGAGTNLAGYLGISADGTAVADVIDGGTSYKGVAVNMLDSSGEVLDFAGTKHITATPTLDAATYTAGDSLHDSLIGFSDAVAGAGRVGHLLNFTVLDKDNNALDDNDLWIHFFSGTVTQAAAQDPWAMSDANMANWLFTLDTTVDGYWTTIGASSTSKVWRMTAGAIPFHCAGTVLYCSLQCQQTPSYTASGLALAGYIARE